MATESKAAEVKPLGPEARAAVRQTLLELLEDPEVQAKLVELVIPLRLPAPAPAEPIDPLQPTHYRPPFAPPTDAEQAQIGVKEAQAVMDLVETKVRALVRPDALRRP